MASFDTRSRYAGLETYEVVDSAGRTVNVMPVPERPEQALRGYHRRRQGQRLDHLAYRYLDDATGYWRIAELNGVLWPDALAEAPEIAIPTLR